jgi:PAS domain S-box-containing protein
MRSPEELALIASIADDLPCGVWVAAAPDGGFVYANRAFEEIMGMGPVPDVGVGGYTHPYGIYGRDGALYPEHRLPFVRALQERATVVVDDLVIHRRDGRHVYVRAFGKPVFDEAGAMVHVAIAFFDITREVEAQTQLGRAERLASLGRLAAGVAHEVNNPLSFVLGSLELCQRELASTNGASFEGARAVLEERLRDACSGAERVRAIVAELKAFSRLDERSRRPVDVRAVLQASLTMAANEIRHRARLVLDLAPVPDVVADEGRLNQVFLNLLVNAAQAIGEGNANGNEIRVVVRPDPGGVCIEVHDSGVGIEPAVLPKIFEPFFTTKGAGAGTGLGLAICHAIVTALGGRIEVESVPGHGTKVRVVLPASTETAATPMPAAAITAPAATRRGSILVVDDEPLIVKLLTKVLEVEHDVACETSAEAALARLRAGERFDAIVCDLMMPQVTGMDLHDVLLEIAPEQARAMLFLTGGAFTPRARAFVERFSEATLDKPVDSRVLKARVRRLVG